MKWGPGPPTKLRLQLPPVAASCQQPGQKTAMVLSLPSLPLANSITARIVAPVTLLVGTAATQTAAWSPPIIPHVRRRSMREGTSLHSRGSSPLISILRDPFPPFSRTNPPEEVGGALFDGRERCLLQEGRDLLSVPQAARFHLPFPPYHWPASPAPARGGTGRRRGWLPAASQGGATGASA